MSDVFSEVDEQLRSDRLRSVATRGWPIALAIMGVALLVFLGAWGWTAWQAEQASRASDAYGQGLEALSKNDMKTAEVRFVEAAKTGPAVYKSLALMQQGGIRMNAGKDAEAVSLLEQAAEADRDPLLADAARLKAALLLMDTRPLAEIERRLQPLAEQGRPYRWQAVEARALARLQAGQLKPAHSDFAVLSLAQDVTEGSRARARAATNLIDTGAAASLPGLIKAALAQPPLPSAAASALAGAAQPAASGAAR